MILRPSLPGCVPLCRISIDTCIDLARAGMLRQGRMVDELSHRKLPRNIGSSNSVPLPYGTWMSVPGRD